MRQCHTLRSLPYLSGLVLALVLGSPARVHCAVPSTTPPPPAPPNLLFILTDDQDLLLGSLDVMPNVRALIAAKGATFSNHFVPLSLCCPSRTTLLTGLHAHNHRVYTNHPPDGGFARFHSLGLEEESLGPVLQRVGYRTGLMGKYVNLYPEGQDKTYVPAGWDEWDAPLGAGGYKAFNYTMNQNGALVVHGATPADYLTDVLRDRALQFIAADPARPFFLYLASFAPHAPSTPAPRHADLFANARAPRTPSFNEADMRDKPAAMRSRQRLTPTDVATLDRQYRLRLQSLQAVDEMVGALVQALGDTGQLANTFIVFTSDNGFHMGQHRMKAGKYTPYEEDVHVPLFVRGPGVAPGVSSTPHRKRRHTRHPSGLGRRAFPHPLDAGPWSPFSTVRRRLSGASRSCSNSSPSSTRRSSPARSVSRWTRAT